MLESDTEHKTKLILAPAACEDMAQYMITMKSRVSLMCRVSVRLLKSDGSKRLSPKKGRIVLSLKRNYNLPEVDS